jgi:hypothetical protein
VTSWQRGTQAAIGASVVAVFLLMTGGSTEGSGEGAERKPDLTAPAPPVTIEPGPPRDPVVLAEAVDPTPTVVAQGARFSPYHVVVPARRRIVLRFENRDPNTLHDLRIQLPGADVASGARPGPAAVEVRFRSPPRPGHYPFVCDIHRTMKGTLHVIR